MKDAIKCPLCGGFTYADKTDDVWCVFVDPGDSVAVVCDQCVLEKFPDAEGKNPMRLLYGMLKKEEGLIWLPKTAKV